MTKPAQPQSLITGKDGRPLRVYHGTSSLFDNFDVDAAKGKTFGTGVFFSSSPEVASTYTLALDGGHVIPCYLAMDKPVVVEARGANWNRMDNKVVIKLPAVTVSDIENETLMAELEGRVADHSATRRLPKKTLTLGQLFGREMKYEDDFASTDDIARWARKEGYPGVHFKNVVDQGPSGAMKTDESSKPHDLFVCFDASQILCAIGNEDLARRPVRRLHPEQMNQTCFSFA